MAPAMQVASTALIALSQFDLVRNFVTETDAADGQHHLRRQFLMTLQAAAVDRITHSLLDLALRGDADLLQKSAQAAFEDVLVHCSFPTLTNHFGCLAWIRGSTAVIRPASPRSKPAHPSHSPWSRAASRCAS